MGKPVPPQPVKLFTGVLTRDTGLLSDVRSRLEPDLGPIDYISPEFPFDLTDYYEQEMGAGIVRAFWSFERLMDPGRLPDVKIFTNAVEMEFFRDGHSRAVNLDPGYLDFYKLVLASVKERAQKIYLGKGIYADPTLYYLKGKWYAYEWSLPDFRDETYYPVFQEIRLRYRMAMRRYTPGGIRFNGFNGT